MRVRECQSYPVDNVALPALKPRFIVSYLTGPDFPVGPRQIDFFGIVHINSGKGWVEQSGPRQPLAAGDTFLIFPRVRYSFWVSDSRAHSMIFECAGLAPLLSRIGVNTTNYLSNGCDAT